MEYTADIAGFKMVGKRMINFLRKNSWTLFSLLIIIPVGFYSKFYQGPFNKWINDSLGGVFYEIFWCLLIFLFLSKTNPWKIVTAVFSITCALEFLQLWHPPFLELIRNNFIGRTIVGTSFVPTDFFYYVAGCFIGWIWIVLLRKHYAINNN